MTQRWIANDFGGLETLELVTVELPPPGAGEVTISVRAAGMNPADFKHVAAGTDRSALPVLVGYEVAGVVTAVGADAGPVAVGDEVLAFRIRGGYATEVTVPARDVFLKPKNLDWTAAANLLLVGTTAAEMLSVVGARAGETILLHGASGAVGVSVLQQARELGVRVIGTTSPANAAVVRGFDGIPIAYGDGLRTRIEEAAPDGVAAALDAVGTAEAVDVSLELVADRARIVTIVDAPRARADGFRIIAGAMPASAAFRDEARSRVIALAERGALTVPVARTFPLDEAVEALRILQGQHPGGKFALVP